MEKILTIVVPTYNMEKYLDKCLSSLIIEKEKMDRLEVLVINDGSKDRSSEIAHSYESKYPQTYRVIDKANGNYGSCVNRGLSEASGKYIKILDADDYLDSKILSKYIEYLNGIDSDMVISNLNEVNNQSGHINPNPLVTPTDDIFHLSELPDESIKALFIHHITYKRSILCGYHQTEGKSYTDLEWTVIPAAKVDTVTAFPYPLYQYVLAREGQTVSPLVHAKNLHMERDVIMSLLDIICSRKDQITESYRNFVNKKLFFLSRSLYDYYLLSLSQYTSSKELLPFDNKLNTLFPDLYYELDSVCIRKGRFQFRYIHEWRKQKSRRRIPFMLYDLYRRRC